MVCLGPRKKEKKAALSPGDGPTSRGIDPSRAKRGSKLKPPSTLTATPAVGTPAKTAPKRTSLVSLQSKRSSSPRASLEKPKAATLAKGPPSRNSLLPGRQSPNPDARPNSPHHTRIGSAATARTSAAAAAAAGRPGTHSRNGSAASVKKSPITQMREDFDELRTKNDKNLELIAKQKAELEQLKQQLAKQPSHPEEDLGVPSPPLSQSTTHSDMSALQAQNEEQVQLLHEKEEALKQRERDLEALRQQLESEKMEHETNKDEVPSSVVSEDKENASQLLAEKEHMLEEKERALEKQRLEWETEKKAHEASSADEVADKLEQLKTQNEEAASRLAEKEKELAALKLQIENGQAPDESHREEDKAMLQKIAELNKQMESQKRAHEESLRLHEEALAEKERLLSEQQQTLAKLQGSHEDEIRKLKTNQTSSILTLKQQHKKATTELQKQLTETEQKIKNNPTVDLESEVERILHEFEQTEHNHSVQIESMQQSHQNELTDLQENHVAQLRNLKKGQSFTKKFLPVEAKSWPAPMPLSTSMSMLRKTNGPQTRPKKIILDAQPNEAPAFLPLDNKKVQIYMSSVSGNPVIKKNQEHIQQLLKTNGIAFELLDVAASEAALQHMKRANNNGSSEGRAKELPQMFVGGEYRGQYEDVLRCVEEQILDTLLKPAAERVLTEEEKTAMRKAKTVSDDPATAPPMRVLPAGPVELPILRKTKTPGVVKPLRDADDDEDLFRELEKELSQGKLDEASLAYL
ncbi:SH3 domain binding glutamic acid-rich protein-like [Apophysomyces sp. BC1034]|nr:SH3 domain binding glutamic acid-rich protein-like [Apophysomyces sp. BC1015]KAG0175778.1 SH3 domain binding glutamic acid-rich protein-like [Apophysomyces sp. BC1021]KAG0186257.1 SH3 domain binding glutamic acid-rich protein-like [Apophysomyces sp. BC1034]